MNKKVIKKIGIILTLPLALAGGPLIVLLVTWIIETVSPPSAANYTTFGETAFALFLISIPVGLVILVPIWVLICAKLFRRIDRAEEPVKDEHVIENISREEAVARMRERYGQDFERDK